ncbi:hypothetical protein FUA48_10925 [Flavobacterium alkalisoli]|uniref:Uncharacterized protein n=1 Tax=Flavobacterium alkalisoli TaxID=2602769 RepID=A0A5B9FYU4_9FLAO|nr:hypothetical protein [Flavobacterium alkalisoli]QEE50072.1 hypothetical protein FUA48_10925 [Flavobacterium alkalisoli]
MSNKSKKENKESEEKRLRYIVNLEKHCERAQDHKKYSTDRFDILVISISTTALIFSIGFVKDFVKGINNVNYFTLKLSWLLFVMTIFFNLISQVSSYYANNYDYLVTKLILKEKRNRKELTCDEQYKQKKYDKRCRRCSKLTDVLNLVCLLFLTIGLVVLIFFFSMNI